ncbi:MAG: DUF4056 domain-containing protein [Planctomycetota bacterium]
MVAVRIGVFLFTLWAAACTYPDRGQTVGRALSDLGIETRDAAFDPPVMRMGTMPFDAWYSPLTPLTVDDLGHHRYETRGAFKQRPDETSRGTLYAVEAGFIDLAHTRNAIDLTRFAFARLAASIYHGDDELRLLGAEPDVYVITLNRPAAWDDLDEADTERLAEAQDAAIAIAGRVAYLMTTWHEVLTAYGYKGLGVVTERPSAFSYDDAVSHRLGVEAAMRALRLDTNLANFDRTVTATLHDVLAEVGAMPIEPMLDRVAAAEGAFWSGSEPTLRVIDLGLDDEPLVARLVDDRVEPRRWFWDGEERIGGQRVSDLFDVEIELHIFEADAIRAAAGRGGGNIVPTRDFARLRESLAKELRP